jgi:DNA-binding MarR family transcriptional regulator
MLVVGRLQRRIRIYGSEPLPPLQLSTLMALSLYGELQVSTASRAEGVTASTMSRVLANLVARGLAERSVDRNDGRRINFALSDDGVRMVDRVQGLSTALIARRIARLDEEHRAALQRGMSALEALLVQDGDSARDQGAGVMSLAGHPLT